MTAGEPVNPIASDVRHQAAPGLVASAPVRVLGHAYLLIALVLEPLTFDPAYFWAQTQPSPVDRLLLPKVLVLAATVALGVLVWLLGSPDIRLASLGRHVRRAPASLVLAWLAIAALVVSTVFATSPLALALTGSNYRLDGALVTGMWLALVPLTFAVMRRLRNKTAWLGYAAFSLALISAYLLVQAYGLEPLSFINHALARTPPTVSATLGHASLASIFVGTGVLVFGILSVAGAPGSRRGLWGALAVLCSASVAAAGGRAGQVALATAWVALAILVVLKRRTLVRPLVVVSLLSVVAFGIVGVTSVHGRGKLVSYSSVAAGDNASFNHRLITWRAGIAAIAERPLFGYGADQAAETLWQHVTPAEERRLYTGFINADEVPSAVRNGQILIYKNDVTGKQSFLRMNYDKAHNYFIDLGLANGLVALALFLAMVIVLLRRLWRSGSVVALAAGVVVAYYLLAGMAWFGTVNVDPFVWTLAGIGLAAAFESTRGAHDGYEPVSRSDGA